MLDSGRRSVKSIPDPVHWWFTTHPLFQWPFGVGEPYLLSPDRYDVYGQHVQPLNNLAGLAGYTQLATANEAAIVLANNDRTVFKGYFDGQSDDGNAGPMWGNLAYHLLYGFTNNNIPWIAESPPSGQLAPGASQTVNITVDAAQLTAGTYPTRILLYSNSGRLAAVEIPVSVIVPGYRTAVNCGGAAYTDKAEGDVWKADKVYAAGSYGYVNAKGAAATIKGDIKLTTDDPLYAAYRSDPLEYKFDGLPVGNYRLELLFAEPLKTKPNLRVFDVIAEGSAVLPAHDIFYEVGVTSADKHSFFFPVTDGQMNVRLVLRRGQASPIVSAIRVTHRPDKK
ncbi:MAG: hypothetical protein EXR72_07165 [Myxococcales bacterium]|nr:hypothetical protein [Myxococcales bacterium]